MNRWRDLTGGFRQDAPESRLKPPPPGIRRAREPREKLPFSAWLAVVGASQPARGVPMMAKVTSR